MNASFRSVQSRLSWWSAGLLLLTLLSISGCQPLPAPAVPAIPEVRIEINADGIVVPSDFPGGIVSVTFKNNDSQDLDVGLERLREGHTIAEVTPLLNDVMANFEALDEATSSMGSSEPSTRRGRTAGDPGFPHR